MNFQTIWMPKVISVNFLSKRADLRKHSYLKYALELMGIFKNLMDVGNYYRRSKYHRSP